MSTMHFQLLSIDFPSRHMYEGPSSLSKSDLSEHEAKNELNKAQIHVPHRTACAPKILLMCNNNINLIHFMFGRDEETSRCWQSSDKRRISGLLKL